MDTHSLNENSVTVLLEELDLTQKKSGPLAKGEAENYDIYGLTDFNTSGKKIQYSE